MGNFFDGGEQNRKSFGGEKRKSITPESARSFSKAEFESLVTLYQTVGPREGDTEETHTQRVSQHLKCTSLAIFLVKNGSLRDLDNYCQFISNGVRINDEKTVTTFWELMPEDSRLSSFCSLLFEIESCSSQQISFISKGLEDFVKSFVRKLTGNDDHVAFPHFLQWMHIYGSSIPKFLSTYLTVLSFESVPNLSFHPFRSPYLEDESEIIRASEIFPLALCREACQGKWKRLYTTATDGLSFNRLVHHVLGYEVQNCATSPSNPFP